MHDWKTMEPKRTATYRRQPAVRRSGKRWVQTVKTVSTAPPPGTFTRPAREIAEIMARPDVSPRGIGSGIRMIQYFINRGGRNLSASRRLQLERAKRILQRRLARESAGDETEHHHGV